MDLRGERPRRPMTINLSPTKYYLPCSEIEMQQQHASKIEAHAINATSVSIASCQRHFGLQAHFEGSSRPEWMKGEGQHDVLRRS